MRTRSPWQKRIDRMRKYTEKPEENPKRTDSEGGGEFNFSARETKTENIPETIQAKILAAKKKLDTFSQVDDFVKEQNKKIASLKRIIVPTAAGDLFYYVIDDTAGGVTEKACLISEAELEAKLDGLSEAETLVVAKEHAIKPNAIIKYPKTDPMTGLHQAVEVQREAIGLRIATILGFPQVTTRTTLMHNTGSAREPCLFVPFGKMSLLTDDIENPRAGQARFVVSKDKPTEDFGRYAAFFMLCSDPDFIGKEGQNKGLAKGTDGKRQLYLFDQVFKPESYLGLDRAFNIVPTSYAASLPNFISRHFVGRNRSVINESSYEEKVRGALGLLSKKSEIKDMFEEIIRINTRPSKAAIQNPVLARTLRDDAIQCRRSFNSRLQSIRKLFPPLKVNQAVIPLDRLASSPEHNESLDILTKSMLLNQLLNRPKLFDKAGKPYTSPFINSVSTRVRGVSIEGDTVSISFARKYGPPLSESKKDLLKAHGFTLSPDGLSATIDKRALLAFNDKQFYKEQADTIDTAHDYLDNNKIRHLVETYVGNTLWTRLDGSLKRTYDEVAARLEGIEGKTGDEKIAALKSLNQNLQDKPLRNAGLNRHLIECVAYEYARARLVLGVESADVITASFRKEKAARGGLLMQQKTNATSTDDYRRRLSELSDSAVTREGSQERSQTGFGV